MNFALELSRIRCNGHRAWVSEQSLRRPHLEFELHLFIRPPGGVSAPSAEPKMVSLWQFRK